MFARRLLALVTAVAVASAAVSVDAQEPAPPAAEYSRWYAVGLVGGTFAYRPRGGPWDGFQHDVSANLGAGRFVGAKWAFELDLGATWVRGEYVSAALTPGALYSFHPNFYAAARFIVPFDPEADLVLFPGVGAIYTFKNGLAPLVEVNLARSLDRRDLGVALTVGLLFVPRRPK
jgi:hypothetical protein